MTVSGPKPYRRILACITEDWFALSHFKPLLRALQHVADDVVVATRDTGQTAAFKDLGVRHVAIDLARRSRSPLELGRAVQRLARLIDALAPDAVHFVAIQTIVIGRLALRSRPDIATAFHLTGLGVLGSFSRPHERLISTAALRMIGWHARRKAAHLFVENPEDREVFVHLARWPADKLTELGGAGVDPDHFLATMPADPPRLGFAGRLVHQKGVHILIEAVRRLRTEGLDAPLDLFARADPTTPSAYSLDEITSWEREGLATWHGHTDDVRKAWTNAAICVAPSISREGLPRAILEAAACARPLVVTDVAGSRHFVRNGVEGLIVPPADPDALAHALRRLLRDPALRNRMGSAARQRVLDGFTEQHVVAAVINAYRAMRGPDSPRG